MDHHHFIDGRWLAGTGDELASINPSTGRPAWHGRAATADEVDRAFAAARAAAGLWCGVSTADRIALVEAVAEQFRRRKADIAAAISTETGKPRWEAAAEVDLMIAKAAVSVDADRQRRSPAERPEAGGATAATRYRPHGVLGVLGPFNMPGHLPNGHVVPAVLAGNAVVYKPSEQAPLVGQIYAEAWAAAGAPPGLVNVVQGDAATGRAVVGHPDLNGLLFTGSATAGRAINRALADRPGVIVALEMGGNNPLVIDDPADLAAAAYLTVVSAFTSAGQRCSCARRLVVPAGAGGDALVGVLVATMARVRVGLPADEPEPFMGPVISAAAADGLLTAQSELARRGGRIVVEMRRLPRSPALLTPGLIDVTAVADRADAEHFGPLLQLVRVADFDAAVREANATRYGLAAGLVGGSRDRYDAFARRVRAGVVNWNRPLTGASSRSPFGGVGDSGNGRPAAFFAADYCGYPVASLEADAPAAVPAAPVGFQP